MRHVSTILIRFKALFYRKSKNTVALYLLNNCDLNLAFWIVYVLYRVYCSQ